MTSNVAMSRRRCVRELACYGVALLGGSCGGSRGAEGAGGASNQGGGEDMCTAPVPADRANWYEVPPAALAEFAAHGAVRIDDDASLVHVWLVDRGGGCYRAVWRICSHGACDVALDPPAGELVCPCHDSRFDLEGNVVKGPAVQPLRVLAVRRDGEALFIERPLG